MEIRRTLRLPLDDLLVVVREFLNPKASRSGLARCLKRHGLNRRPVEDKDAPIVRKTFKDYAPGFVHLDIKYLPQMQDETARQWGHRFVQWYNGEHRHSAIRYITPNQRHEGLDTALLRARKVVYEEVKKAKSSTLAWQYKKLGTRLRCMAEPTQRIADSTVM